MDVRCSLVAFVLLATFAFAAGAGEEEQLLSDDNKKFFKQCMSETSTTPDDIYAFLKKETPKNDVKCTIKCFMIHLKSMKEDGTLDADVLGKYTEESKRESITKCIAEAKSADPCEKAGEFQTCYLAAEPERGLEMAKKLME